MVLGAIAIDQERRAHGAARQVRQSLRMPFHRLADTQHRRRCLGALAWAAFASLSRPTSSYDEPAEGYGISEPADSRYAVLPVGARRALQQVGRAWLQRERQALPPLAHPAPHTKGTWRE